MILVTGGAGYIGSHTCVELINAGFDVVVIDNLSNSSTESINRVETITKVNVPFYNVDIRDKSSLINVFQEQKITAVIHFAGLKSVNESIASPLEYYDNNVCGSICLVEVMKIFNCSTLIFSSSASIYGNSKILPITENCALMPLNPYSKSKLIVENILKDISSSDGNWKVALLRYFNPIGAHNSGFIGESGSEAPNNIMPYLLDVASQKRPMLRVFGNDYKTHDGTGVRDYIHVTDLAQAHVKTISALENKSNFIEVNLGTGKGYSVFELIKTLENVSGRKIPYEVVSRRDGDVAICYADNSKATELLNWQARFSLKEMCEDAWRWHTMNPEGYD